MNVYRRFDPDVSPDQIDALSEDAVQEAPSPVPYPRAGQCLEALQHKNLVVMSSHPELTGREEARNYGFTRYFDEIHGGISGKRDVIKAILDTHSYDDKETAYVGDISRMLKQGRKLV